MDDTRPTVRLPWKAAILWAVLTFTGMGIGVLWMMSPMRYPGLPHHWAVSITVNSIILGLFQGLVLWKYFKLPVWKWVVATAGGALLGALAHSAGGWITWLPLSDLCTSAFQMVLLRMYVPNSLFWIPVCVGASGLASLSQAALFQNIGTLRLFAGAAAAASMVCVALVDGLVRGGGLVFLSRAVGGQPGRVLNGRFRSSFLIALLIAGGVFTGGRLILQSNVTRMTSGFQGLMDTMQIPGEIVKSVRERDFRQAEVLYRKMIGALRNTEANNFPTGRPLFEALKDLGELLLVEDRLTEADVLLKEAVGLIPSLSGQDDLSVVEPVDALAELYDRQGRRDEAAQFYLRAAQVYGQHGLGLGALAFFESYADFLARGTRPQEALVWRKKADNLWQERKGQEGSSAEELAKSSFGNGQLLEAERLYHHAWEAWKARGKGEPAPGAAGFQALRRLHEANFLNDYALYLRTFGRLKEAEEVEREATRSAPAH